MSHYTPEKNLPNTVANRPRFGERLLQLLLTEEDCEAIAGDLAEEFQRNATKFGLKKANIRYWLDIVQSMPSLLMLSHKKLTRRKLMQPLTYLQQNNRAAAIGLILIVPASILVIGGLLQSLLGMSQFNDTINFDLVVFHPTIILGGLALAFGLNLLSVGRIKFQEGKLIGTLQITGKLWSLALLGAIGLMGAIIFVYLLAENFQIFAG